MQNMGNSIILRTRQFLDRMFSAVSGDPRYYSLEHRLFNTISLLNAVTNLGGALFILNKHNYPFLLLLQVGTGVLFLIFYYFSRFRNLYRPLYWPFVLLIGVCLFVKSRGNAGSRGGAHYYFIPALVIAIVLSRRAFTTILAIALVAVTTSALLLLEHLYPEWIIAYSTPRERLFDTLLSFV